MTAGSNFKTLERARMAETCLNYTAARALVLKEKADQAVAAEREHRTLVSRFYKDGALTSFPAKRRARAHVLLYLVNYFEPGARYTEKQVNETLKVLWPDFAYLRRELVDYGYLKRDDLAGIYWLTNITPDRWDTVLHNEAPDWEAIWLPAYLNGEADRFTLEG